MCCCHGNIDKYKQALKIDCMFVKNLVIRFSVQFACNQHVMLLTSWHYFKDNLPEGYFIIPCQHSQKHLKFSLLRFNCFQYLSYLIPKVFLWQISWNSNNKWFSRNRHISRKAILHSITTFYLLRNALHLTGFFGLQWKVWELLGSLHWYLF